jgi:hypothetical protein
MKNGWLVIGSNCIRHLIVDNFFHLNRIGANGRESHVMVLSGSKAYVSRNSGSRAVEGVGMTKMVESGLDFGVSGGVDSVSEVA